MSLVNSATLVMFFVTGIANVVLIKWADNLRSRGSDGVYRCFQHPLFQTTVMMVGELLCFIIFKIAFAILRKRRDGSEDVNLLTAGGREFSIKIFVIPALCDIAASSLFLIGLYLSYASSSQILRGTALIFVGLFSCHFLNQTLKCYHWLGILTISLGALLVCVADLDNARNQIQDNKAVLTGDLLIIISQVFQALQLIYEEKYIKAFNIPALQAIGWKGIFGLAIIMVLLIPLNFLKIGAPFGYNTRGVVEDLPDAILELFNNYQLLIAHGLFLLSVTLYNYSGINITKNASSVNRILIDNTGIIFIWVFALCMTWEIFHVLELIGFLVLLIGIFTYKNNACVQCCIFIRGRISERGYLNFNEEVTSQPADAI